MSQAPAARSRAWLMPGTEYGWPWEASAQPLPLRLILISEGPGGGPGLGLGGEDDSCGR